MGEQDEAGRAEALPPPPPPPPPPVVVLLDFLLPPQPAATSARITATAASATQQHPRFIRSICRTAPALPVIRCMRRRFPASGIATSPVKARPPRRHSTANLGQSLNKTLCIVNRFSPDLCKGRPLLHGCNIVSVAIWRRFMAFRAASVQFCPSETRRRAAPCDASDRP